MSAVPAWKRLGLKLKGPSSDGSPVSAAAQQTTSSASAPPPASRFGNHQQQANGHLDSGRTQYGTPGGFNNNKRKDLPSRPYSSDNKRQRRDDYSDFTPSRKSVSFSQDTKKAAPKKPKKKKKAAPKQQTPAQPFDFGPMVEYLRTWDKARDSWKFNKNHQTLLIKHLYKSDSIPSSDIETFYKYISDIKGGSRSRLVEQAEEIQQKDMKDGPKGFPEGTKAPEEKQKEYEETLADLMKKAAEVKEEGATSPGSSTGKRSFDEVEFALRPLDKAVQQRVIKRMRAESVIERLQSSDGGEAAAPAPISTTSSRVKVPLADGEANAANGKDGQKLKAKRRKKLRTADSSSSESDSDSDSSDSDSDSDEASSAAKKRAASGSSSSDSSDSDSDEEMATADGIEADGSSSSSSSSSESGSDSEGDSASDATADEAEDSGSEGDSESSASDDEDDD